MCLVNLLSDYNESIVVKPHYVRGKHSIRLTPYDFNMSLANSVPSPSKGGGL